MYNQKNKKKDGVNRKMKNKKGRSFIKFLAIIGILSVVVGIALTVVNLLNKTNSLEKILISKKLGNVAYGKVPTKGGLYYWNDQNKYIFRGGIRIKKSDGYIPNPYDKTTDIANYVKVPWENNNLACSSSTDSEVYYTSSPCWRIVSITPGESITIVRDQNLSTKQVFDDTYNTASGGANGYNDLLENVPSKGHPEEYRQYSQMYNRLYGPSGYQNSILKKYYYLLEPLDVCLNKVNEYVGINHPRYATSGYVKDTCDVNRKSNTLVVKPLSNQYVRLPYTEEHLNASIDINCTRNDQYPCQNKNFMCNTQAYWSLNGYASNSWSLRIVEATGRANIDNQAINSIGVRPVVNLKSSILITGGTGTATNPYIISP